MTLNISMYEVVGIAVLLLLVGSFIKSKITIFRKYAIPSPVIGGLLFACFVLLFRETNILYFQLDDTLQEFFMLLFFTSIGFNVSLKLLKKGGKSVLIFLGLATALCLLQNFVAVALAKPVNVHPQLALMTGSIALTGGLGTSAAIAPLVEANGIIGAKTIAIASATFGMVIGSLMGAPIGNNLIVRKGLFTSAKRESVGESLGENDEKIDLTDGAISGKRISIALFLMLIAIGIGVLLTDALDSLLGLISNSTKFPIYIGPMIVGAIIRNTIDAKKGDNCNAEIQLLGDISLSVFISIAIMTLRLWELSGLAFSMIILLIAQVILMYLFVRFISFNLLGKNYDAAVISSGLVGFGMGSTANAMANLDSLCGKFGYSRMAYFVVPIVGALIIDFINVIAISLFIAFL